MKRQLLIIFAMLLTATVPALAISNNTVEIVYNGSTATVTIASNIQNYVTVSSGTSSHVVLTQADTFAGVDPTTANTDGEITYSLSGTSSDGSFTLNGSYKCVVALNDLTLHNTAGPALILLNGKRVEVSAKNGTTNTLSDAVLYDTDGTTLLYNGCIHCKGHLKLKGKGTLNVTGNAAHAIYSKEYCEVKNCTVNVTKAVKDGLHCKEYFLMESGTLNIANTGDDALQVEYANDVITAETTDHEDENTGNFYQTAGTLTFQSFGGYAIKADGTIRYDGGSRNFDSSKTLVSAGIDGLKASTVENGETVVYDLRGRVVPATQSLTKGIYIAKNGTKATKKYVK